MMSGLEITEAINTVLVTQTQRLKMMPNIGISHFKKWESMTCLQNLNSSLKRLAEEN